MGGGLRSACLLFGSNQYAESIITNTVKPGFASTLETLVNKTLERIDKSLELIWIITQQQSVDLKINASIESVLLILIPLVTVLMSLSIGKQSKASRFVF